MIRDSDLPPFEGVGQHFLGKQLQYVGGARREYGGQQNCESSILCSAGVSLITNEDGGAVDACEREKRGCRTPELQLG